MQILGMELVVDDTGAFVYTGEADDGVDVSIKPNKLVTTMHQYATSGQPLNQITVQYKTADGSEDFSHSAWVDSDQCTLIYDTTASDGTYLNTDDEEHNHSVSSGYVTYDITSSALQGYNLDNLFSQETIVTVSDTKATGTLELFNFIRKVDKDVLTTKTVPFTIKFYGEEISFDEFTITISKRSYASGSEEGELVTVDGETLEPLQLTLTFNSNGEVILQYNSEDETTFFLKDYLELKSYEYLVIENIPVGLNYYFKGSNIKGNGYFTQASIYAPNALHLHANDKGTSKIEAPALPNSVTKAWGSDESPSHEYAVIVDSSDGTINSARLNSYFQRTIGFYKVDLINNEKALEGVRFAAIPATNGNSYYPAKDDNGNTITDNGGNYTWTEESMKILGYTLTTAGTSIQEFSSSTVWSTHPEDSYRVRYADIVSVASNSSGYVNLSPLSAGCYRLIEFVTLDGYTLPTAQWNIYIPDDTTKDFVITAVTENSDGTYEAPPPAFYTGDDGNLYLPNYSNINPPITGATGIKWYIFLASISLFLGVTLFGIYFRYRKKRY